MGIETSLERVANALERIASTLEANTTINDWYKNHLASKEAAKVETALAEAHVGAPSEPAPAPVAAPAAPEMSYEELKAFLIARGVGIPKGTKMTTLKKLYEKHKNTAPIDPLAEGAIVLPDGRIPPADKVPASDAPFYTQAKISEPASASAAAPEDPFSIPAAAPAQAPAQAPAKEPMTKEEATKRIQANYQATEEDRKAFIEALAAAGVPAGGSFQDVEDGKFDVLVETYEHIKGIANA